MQRRITILCSFLAGAVQVALSGGCLVRTEMAAAIHSGGRIAPDRVEVGESDWPETWGPMDGPRGVIMPVEGPLTLWRGVHLGEHHYLHAGEVERADAAGLAAGLDMAEGFQFRAENPGAFVYVRDPLYEGPEARPMPTVSESKTAELFKVVMGWPSDPWNGVERLRIERTWMALYDPIGIERAETKGVIVVIPGMFGTPEPMIESLVGTLRRRGWSVLRLMSHPSRFTERLQIELTGGNEQESVQRVAYELGIRAAGCAYAVDLGLDHTMTRRSELAGKPTVLLGMSGGAIVLPTVHAWNPDRYDAAVLIAGGVNFFEINLRSNYADWIEALVVDAAPGTDGVQRPTGEQVKELSQMYLEHAPLDGTHLAPMLVGKPTLMIHGSADRAVPADLGQKLWELAGQPERWTLPVGHELIFAAMPFQAGGIERWLSDALFEPTVVGAKPEETP